MGNELDETGLGAMNQSLPTSAFEKVRTFHHQSVVRSKRRLDVSVALKGCGRMRDIPRWKHGAISISRVRGLRYLEIASLIVLGRLTRCKFDFDMPRTPGIMTELNNITCKKSMTAQS